MIKQVTVTDLQRRAAEVIISLREGPVVVNRRGRPVAVILTAEAYEQMEQAVAEVETKQVREIVEAGLASYGAGRTSPRRPLRGVSAPAAGRSEPRGCVPVRRRSPFASLAPVPTKSRLA
jgi:prevent-host-death family protein